MKTVRLLADIGGTNARFALAGEGGSLTPDIFPVAQYGQFGAALDAFLDARHVSLDAIDSCAIAAAGPVDDGVVRLTNAPWTIDTAQLSDRLDCPVGVLNDLEAVACALPVLLDTDLDVLHAGGDATVAPMIAVNVGTGFGAAVAIPTPDGWHPLATEPGHMRLPDGAGTVEDILSGPGLARLRGADAQWRTRFSHLLGRVTRDLVLATGSWGGVRFCGGVMGAWGEMIDRQVFDDAFFIDGPMAEHLAEVSLARIIHPTPALLGLLNARID